MRARPILAAVTLAVAVLAGAGRATPAATPASGIPDRAPIASPATGQAKGTVMLIHGGSWVTHGPRAARREHRRHAARLNALGFDTVAITYRPGVSALGDVVAFYDALRRRAGRGESICALGDSAGGHLALMLAARRLGLDCAISRGAPADLRLAHGVWLPVVTHLLAPYTPLARISPVTYADRLADRVLASHALHDPVVAHDQLVLLRRASGGRLETVTLPPGSADFVHAPVDRAALTRLERAEARVLDRAARR